MEAPLRGSGECHALSFVWNFNNLKTLKLCNLGIVKETCTINGQKAVP